MLRVWSKIALGWYFTYTVQTSTDQPVIASGPTDLYDIPPAGILLIVTGAGAVWGNWLGLAAVLVATPWVSYRIHAEEQALRADRYRIYSEYHKRLLPHIW